MDSWLVDYLASGLQSRHASAPVCAFRIVLAVAALVKFGVEHRRGGWSFLRPDRYLAVAHRRAWPRAAVGLTGYRVLYCVKFAAAGALLVGVAPRLAALLLAGWCFFELSYDEENHTTLMAVCALALVASDGLADCFTWETVTVGVRDGFGPVVARELAATSDPFAALLIVVLVCQMYWTTAYRKLRSTAFTSGVLLYRVFDYLRLVGPELPHRQAWYPRRFVRLMLDGEPAAVRRRWRCAALATVALELALPVGLLWPPAWPYAALAGLAMHSAFNVMLPVRLTPFGLTAVGSYLLFAPS